MKTNWDKTYTTKKATIRISFLVGVEELGFILAYMCNADTCSSEESLKRARLLTKVEIEAATRLYLREGGQDIFEDTAIFCDDKNYKRQFELVVLEKFPEFNI